MKNSLSKSILSQVKPILQQARESLEGDSSLHLVLAVSGGIDSIVLLHFLNSISRNESLALSVAHFDHGLRAESSDEQTFVAEIAEKLGLGFYGGKAEPYDGLSNLEAWAREQRYAFLENARVGAGAKFVATAHHLDDQAETCLMRFLNGRMATSSFNIAKLDEQRRLVRPFLSCSQQQIEDYAKSVNLEHREDPSNESLQRTRNLYRKTILPFLQEELSTPLINTLSYTSERLACDEEFMNSAAKSVVLEAIDASETRFLVSLDRALRWRVLHLIARESLGEFAERLGYLSLFRLSSTLEGLKDNSEREIELVSKVKCHFRRDGRLEFFLD